MNALLAIVQNHWTELGINLNLKHINCDSFEPSFSNDLRTFAVNNSPFYNYFVLHMNRFKLMSLKNRRIMSGELLLFELSNGLVCAGLTDLLGFLMPMTRTS